MQWGVIVFYDRFIELCQRKGVSPTRAALEAGISKSLVSKWKANASREPSPEVIRKLADYFELSPYEVVAAKTPGNENASPEDAELNEYLEILLDSDAKSVFSDPEMINTAEEFLEKSGWRRDNPELCSECYLFENHICRKIQGKIWYFSRIQYENGLRGMKQGFN